jgi:hypothetical protein
MSCKIHDPLGERPKMSIRINNDEPFEDVCLDCANELLEGASTMADTDTSPSPALMKWVAARGARRRLEHEYEIAKDNLKVAIKDEEIAAGDLENVAQLSLNLDSHDETTLTRDDITNNRKERKRVSSREHATA